MNSLFFLFWTTFDRNLLISFPAFRLDVDDDNHNDNDSDKDTADHNNNNNDNGGKDHTYQPSE